MFQRSVLFTVNMFKKMHEKTYNVYIKVMLHYICHPDCITFLFVIHGINRISLNII